MTVYGKNLGYREVAMLAEFMLEVSEKGIDCDVPVKFGFNNSLDCAFVETENGETIFADDF